MKILAIETSFDEAGLSIIEYSQTKNETTTRVLSDVLFSQADEHKKYGGVYPTLAKQIHAKNIVALLTEALKGAGLYKEIEEHVPQNIEKARVFLEREPEMFTQLKELVAHIQRPDLDAIAITNGPGLEPALWVGISFAKALSVLWDIPLSPVNHMEGHIAAALAHKEETNEDVFTIPTPPLPAIALLISGAHTELVYMKEWLHYEKIGSTRDDAIGEAFDKVARLLDLGYPGGPLVSKLAREAREQNAEKSFTLPRPMLHSGDYDFSLSGIKTAVLKIVQDNSPLTELQKMQIAREFEDAVTEVFVSKIKNAIEEYAIASLIISGGVAANAYILDALRKIAEENSISFYVPTMDLATDNGRMIAFASALRNSPTKELDEIVAEGNLKLY